MLNRIFSHTPEKARQPAVGWLARAWLILVLLMQCLFSSAATAQNLTASAQSNSTSRTGVSVSLPNGYASIRAEDMRLMSTAGEVRWMRQWDGQEWKFQPQWESLSQSWKNLTGD